VVDLGLKVAMKRGKPTDRRLKTRETMKKRNGRPEFLLFEYGGGDGGEANSPNGRSGALRRSPKRVSEGGKWLDIAP